MSSEMPRGTELPAEIAEALEQSRQGNCPAPDLLQAAQAGVLSPEFGGPVLRHLEYCSACKTLLDSLTVLDDAPIEAEQRERIWRRIQAESRLESSPASSSRNPWWTMLLRPWPSAAVGLAFVAIALVAGLLRERGQTPRATTPSRPVEVASSSPVLPLEKAPIVLPAAAFLVWRGQDDENPWKPLQAALKPYEARDYKEAAQRLQEVAVKHPRVAEAWFYLGVSHLFSNANDEARDELGKAMALAQSPLLEQSKWYLAIAYERTGRREDARRALQELCTVPDDSSKACRGLHALPVIK